MSITYNSNIPFSTHAPASDQPIMLTNALAISQIWGIDHNTFDSTGQGTSLSGSGRHLRVTFDGKNALTGTITDPLSVLYTANGTASTVSQLFLANQNATYQVSAIAAWAIANSSGIIATQSSNVASVVRASTGVYNVTLTTGACSSANYGVLISYSASQNLSFRYVITNSTTFAINFFVILPADPTSFTFLVLQI